MVSVQFSRSVMSDSLWPHGLQHARPPCPSPTPKAYSNSSPLSRWCLPTISSSIVPFSSCLQSFPASGSFQMSQSVLHIRWPKYWSFSFNISPSNGHPGLISLRKGWLDLLAVQETLKSLLQHHSSKTSILRCSAFFIVQLSHLFMTTRKTLALIRQTFVGKVISLLFNKLPRLVKTFLPRSNFMVAITICSDFGAQVNSLSLFPLFIHLFAMKWWDWTPWSLFSELLSFKPTFSPLSLS